MFKSFIANFVLIDNLLENTVRPYTVPQLVVSDS